MKTPEIDYTNYSLEELLECKENIDADAYPERAAQINLLIKDRAKGISQNHVQRVSMADEHGNIASVKTGRGVSFGKGISEIVGGLLVGFFVLSASGENSHMRLLAYFAMIAGIVAGSYHLYNAFGKNRFSETDIVSPSKEIDPFESITGQSPYQESSTEMQPSGTNNNSTPRKYEGDFCPFCRAKVENNFDFCPVCGKDI